MGGGVWRPASSVSSALPPCSASCCSQPPRGDPTAATPCARSSTTPATSSPASNVKIDGVKVGTVGSVTPTPQAKAAVVLNIEDPGFQDFRADASCTIRPQALIGEKYVDCLPTQPRVEGTPLPPPLHKIPSGQEGEGRAPAPRAEHPQPRRRRPARRHQPPARTPAPHDHPQRTRRRPGRARKRPGRGHPSRQPGAPGTRQGARDPRQREPRAGETRRRLRQGARPVRRRPRTGGGLHRAEQQGRPGERRHRGALARNLQLFPPFLKQLGPAMERVGRFAEQTTPAFTDLGLAAPGDRPGVHRTTRVLRAAPPSSITSLGKTAKQSGPALVATKPLLSRLKALGSAAKPFSEQPLGTAHQPAQHRRPGAPARLHLPGHGRRQRLRRARALPAHRRRGLHLPESRGHGNAGCAHNLISQGSSAGSAATASAAINPNTEALVMARTLAVIEGATPAQALAKYPGSAPTASEIAALGSAGGSTAAAQPVGGSTAGTTYYTPSQRRLRSRRDAAQLPARKRMTR